MDGIEGDRDGRGGLGGTAGLMEGLGGCSGFGLRECLFAAGLGGGTSLAGFAGAFDRNVCLGGFIEGLLTAPADDRPT